MTGEVAQLSLTPSPPYGGKEMASQGLGPVFGWFVFYLLCSGPSLFYGYQGFFRVCENNFEGGCSYGQMWDVLISFALTIFLSTPFAILFVTSAWKNKSLSLLTKWISTLAASPPFIFIAIGMFELIRLAMG